MTTWERKLDILRRDLFKYERIFKSWVLTTAECRADSKLGILFVDDFLGEGHFDWESNSERTTYWNIVLSLKAEIKC